MKVGADLEKTVLQTSVHPEHKATLDLNPWCKEGKYSNSTCPAELNSYLNGLKSAPFLPEKPRKRKSILISRHKNCIPVSLVI